MNLGLLAVPYPSTWAVRPVPLLHPTLSYGDKWRDGSWLWLHQYLRRHYVMPAPADADEGGGIMLSMGLFGTEPRYIRRARAYFEEARMAMLEHSIAAEHYQASADM